MTDYHTRTLDEVLRRLRENGFVPAAARYMKVHAEAINAELNTAVLSEIPAFSTSGNPDVLPELTRHGPALTGDVLRLLRGGAVGEFDFVRDHARRRAEQRFPLEATLHTYRCAHKVFSRWLREAAMSKVTSSGDARQVVAAVADFAIEYTDAISTIAAGAYVAQTRLLADVAGDQRAELLRILLEGYDESDGRVAKILRDAGYLVRRQAFCVALVRPVDPAEMINPGRARRLADSIEEIFRSSPMRCLIDLRHDKVTMIFSDVRRVSGWTTPHTSLARRLTPALLTAGNAVLAGISNDVPSTSHIPNAYREALLALELANVTQRVVQFADIPTRRLLLHLAGEEFQRILPTWTRDFLRANDNINGALIKTLRAYADADMNVLKTAHRLSVHPNTVYSRLQKVTDATGLDAKSFHHLTELLIVADCRREHDRVTA